MINENWMKIERDFGPKMDIKLTITIAKDEMDSVNIIINVYTHLQLFPMKR